MSKARNSIRYPSSIKEKAASLRKNGRTHREIVRELGVSLGIACDWTKDISLTVSQRADIQRRKNKHVWSQGEKDEISSRLAPYRTKYTKEDLLARIRDFYSEHGRIPLRREFNAGHIYNAHFGSWNKAVEAAGFDTNPVLFAKKFIAKDGHTCDSFTEKVIDDWLFRHGIPHTRHVAYGKTKFTADFAIPPNTIIEFFGLAGSNAAYDQNIEKKRALSKKLNCKLIEIYPDDIYPKSRLETLIKL